MFPLTVESVDKTPIQLNGFRKVGEQNLDKVQVQDSEDLSASFSRCSCWISLISSLMLSLDWRKKVNDLVASSSCPFSINQYGVSGRKQNDTNNKIEGMVATYAMATYDQKYPKIQILQYWNFYWWHGKKK